MEKILIIKKDIKDRKSGAPRIVFDQIKFFKAKGFEVHICGETLLSDEITLEGAIAHKTFKWPFDGVKRRRFFAKQAYKYQQKIKPALTIGHGDSFYDDVSYIHNCVHLAHQKIHEKPIENDHPVALIHEENFKLQNFKRIVTNSKMMKDDLINRFHIAEVKFELEYPKYDAVKFFKDDSKRSSMRAELKIQDDEFLVGLVTSGNFKKRNVSFFLEVMNEVLKSTDKKIKILIAGKNKDTKFQDYTKENGFNEKVIFAPSIGNVEDYYNALDLFVLPAKIEEFGLSVVEAMRCGALAIVSDTVGSGELFEGELSSCRITIDKEQFTKQILKIIQDNGYKNKILELGNNVINEYPARYSFKHLLNLIK